MSCESSTCSPGPEAACSPTSCSATPSSELSRSTTTASASSRKGRKTASSPSSPSSEISPHSTLSTPETTRAWLTALRAASPASRSLSPASDPPTPTSATSGLKRSAQFGWFVRDESSSRTYLASSPLMALMVDATSQRFCADLPNWGMWDGTGCWGLMTPERRTEEAIVDRGRLRRLTPPTGTSGTRRAGCRCRRRCGGRRSVTVPRWLPGSQTRRLSVSAKGSRTLRQLSRRKLLVRWPSPVATEARQGYQDRTRGKKGTQESLTTVAVNVEQKWPTPVAQTGDGGLHGLDGGAGAPPRCSLTR